MALIDLRQLGSPTELSEAMSAITGDMFLLHQNGEWRACDYATLLRVLLGDMGGGGGSAAGFGGYTIALAPNDTIADGNATSFVLRDGAGNTFSPLPNDVIFAFVGGLKTNEFTLSGATVTFASPPPSGEVVSLAVFSPIDAGNLSAFDARYIGKIATPHVGEIAKINVYGDVENSGIPATSLLTTQLRDIPYGVPTLDGDGMIRTEQLPPSLDAIPLAQKGVAGGVATLDDGGRVPFTQLPSLYGSSDEEATPSSVARRDEVGRLKAVAPANPDEVTTKGYVDSADYTLSTNLANLTATVNSLSPSAMGAIPSTQKGAANGVATLDGTSKVPTAQIPTISLANTTDAAAEDRLAVTQAQRDKIDDMPDPTDIVLVSELGDIGRPPALGSDGKLEASVLPEHFQGGWNANTDTPTLTGNQGDYDPGNFFRVTTAGSTNLDGVTTWNVGDIVRLYPGTPNYWAREATGTVISVCSVTPDGSGEVTLDAADVGATPDTHIGTGGTEHAAATTSVAGFLSAADKTKLDDVATGAQVNPANMSDADVTTGTDTTPKTPTAAQLKLAAETHGGGGSGTIADDAVTNAKLANMAEATIKGRAAASGTGDPADLTATQARTILNVANGAQVNPSAMTDGDVTVGTGTTPKTPTPAQLKLAAQTWGSGATAGMANALPAISDLKAVSKPSGFTARIVTGNSGGLWVWDNASTDTENSYTIVAANAGGTGRWKRVNASSFADARWFGAVCNGAADDTAALTAARNFALAFSSTIAGVVVPGDIKVPNGLDMSGLSFLCTGTFTMNVGSTLTFGGTAATGKPLSVEVAKVSDGAAVLSARATPQVRISGINARYEFGEVGYVQLLSNGSNSSAAACSYNVVDIGNGYLLETTEMNSGGTHSNKLLGRIAHLKINTNDTVVSYDNRFDGVIQGVGADNATVFVGYSVSTEIVLRAQQLLSYTTSANCRGLRVVPKYESGVGVNPDNFFQPTSDTWADSGWLNFLTHDIVSNLTVTRVMASPRPISAAAGTILDSVKFPVQGGDVILISGDAGVWRPRVECFDANHAAITSDPVSSFNLPAGQGWVSSTNTMAQGTTMPKTQVLQVKPGQTAVAFVKVLARVQTSGGPYSSGNGLSVAIARPGQNGVVLGGEQHGKINGGLPVTSATVSGLVKTIEAFGPDGVSIGHIPVYSTRT